MIIIENTPHQSKFAPNVQMGMYLIFGIGVISSFILLLGILFAAAYVLNLVCLSLVEMAHQVSTLYISSDPALKLLMIVLAGYCLIKLFRLVMPRR